MIANDEVDLATGSHHERSKASRERLLDGPEIDTPVNCVMCPPSPSLGLPCIYARPAKEETSGLSLNRTKGNLQADSLCPKPRGFHHDSVATTIADGDMIGMVRVQAKIKGSVIEPDPQTFWTTLDEVYSRVE